MALDFNTLLQEMLGGNQRINMHTQTSGGLFQPTNSGAARVWGPNSSQAGWEGDVTKTLEQQKTTNMDPASVAALQNLIQQLLSGGTAEMQQQRATRNEEIVTNRDLRADYTKGNAQLDANAAVEATTRQAMEQALGQMARAVLGAGTSQNSMRALLTQNAERDAAESAAKLGLETQVQYGNLAAQFSSILEALTRPDNAITTALLQALETSKGVNPETTTMKVLKEPKETMKGGRVVGGAGGAGGSSVPQNVFGPGPGVFGGGPGLSEFGEPAPTSGIQLASTSENPANVRADAASLWNSSNWGVRK